MNMMIQQLSTPTLLTDNLPIELKPNLHKMFIQFLETGVKSLGLDNSFMLSGFGQSNKRTVYHIEFKQMEGTTYHIEQISLSEFDEGRLIETDYFVNYHASECGWMTTLAVMKQYGSAEALVKTVLNVFNESATGTDGFEVPKPIDDLSELGQLIQDRIKDDDSYA